MLCYTYVNACSSALSHHAAIGYFIIMHLIICTIQSTTQNKSKSKCMFRAKHGSLLTGYTFSAGKYFSSFFLPLYPDQHHRESDFLGVTECNVRTHPDRMPNHRGVSAIPAQAANRVCMYTPSTRSGLMEFIAAPPELHWQMYTIHLWQTFWGK